MRKNLTAIGFLFGLLMTWNAASAQVGPIPVSSGQDDPQYFFDSQTALSGLELEEALNHLATFTDKMKVRRSKYNHQAKFLKYLFYKVHQKYLANYQPQAHFEDLLSSKRYDCLTATALYAIILKELNIDYKIVETEFHIFLLVRADKNEFLFESTDPLAGFISDKDQIAAIIDRFNQPPSEDTGDDYYQFSLNIYNHIGLKELAGLHYYNQAVSFYNQKQIVPALEQLEMAIQLYPSPRLSEFKGLILQNQISASNK